MMDEFLDLCSREPLESSEELEQKVRRVPLHRHGNAGWYPIHYAAKYGRGDIVTVLVSKCGCDPHLLTRDTRSTALHIACEYAQTKVIEALCLLIPDGTPSRRDRNGNTPLHVACRVGAVEIVKTLTTKYSGRSQSIRETNGAGSTPFGIAVKEGHRSIAQFLLSQKEAVGNPANVFSDFRERFSNFRHKQSLDHPVNIFVMGDRKTGKSTLIKSVQIEGYINRTLGVFLPTSDVENHSGGIAPSDASTYGYGRAKFYELTSCQQTMQEDVFSKFAKTGKAIFVIVISFKQEMREMQSNLLYWLSFIHNQWKNPSTQPYVVVVGSFLFYRPLRLVRLDNHHRLYLVYHRVLGAHQELCSNFHFVGRFSMDCRLSTSIGMDQFRKVLHRKCRELRTKGGEETVPSSCYVLWSALESLRPENTDPPVMKLSEIQRMISSAQTSSSQVSLFGLLPNQNQNYIHSLLVKLEERKAVHIVSHLDTSDPWIIFDELKLITIVDIALMKQPQPSEDRYDNPAIMSDDQLILSLSSLSSSLKKDLILYILHYFMITEVMARGNDTRYFLPSVLTADSANNTIPNWDENDPKYSIGFAHCVVPQSDQLIPFFMPRYLYFLLYELNCCNDDCENITMSHSSLYFEITNLLQVYITINSSAIVINFRCTERGIYSSLRFRNQFVSIIHQQRANHQPNVLVTEYFVSMHNISLPVKRIRHISRDAVTLGDLKRCLISPTPSLTDPNASKLRSFEPYEWLSKLQKQHLNNLTNHNLTNVEVSKSFIRDLSKCVGPSWKLLVDVSGILQNCDTSSPSDSSGRENYSGQESSDASRGTSDSLQRPTFHTLLKLFSSMSIFHNDLATALKNPELFSIDVSRNQNQSDNSQSEEQQQPLEEEDEQQNLDDSTSDIPQSSSSSTSQAIFTTSGQNLSQHSHIDALTLKTCSTNSDASSEASTISNVPSMKARPAPPSFNHTQSNIQFVGQPQILRFSSSGGTYTDPVHEVSFTVPPQAVKDGTEVEIEYAIAVVGPFSYPDMLTPVSSIVRIRTRAPEKLRKPLRIGIPHAVHIASQQQMQQLKVLCAQEQGNMYAFVRAHKASKVYSNQATLSTKLSKPQYFFCVAATKCKEIISMTQYYLVLVTPNNTLTYSWKLYFFVTYALPACVELVRQQFDDGHTVEEKGFHFKTSSDATDPCITLEHTKLTPENWRITKEGSYKQIEASKVVLGNKSSFEISCHMYPPNFAIGVRGHQATGDSFVELCFKGTTQTEVFYEIILTLPRRRTLMSTSTVEDEIEPDPKPRNPSQISEEDRAAIPRHYSLPGGHASPSHSSKSEPISILYTRSRGDQSSPPTNPFIHMMDTEKRHAIEVLTNNYDNICSQLSNRTIRRNLVQLRAITIDEAQVLMEIANTSESDANERLIQIIQRGGVHGFKQFMTALEKTSADNKGHQDIFMRLVSELNHIRPHSQSATEILSSVAP